MKLFLMVLAVLFPLVCAAAHDDSVSEDPASEEPNPTLEQPAPAPKPGGRNLKAVAPRQVVVERQFEFESMKQIPNYFGRDREEMLLDLLDTVRRVKAGDRAAGEAFQERLERQAAKESYDGASYVDKRDRFRTVLNKNADLLDKFATKNPDGSPVLSDAQKTGLKKKLAVILEILPEDFTIQTSASGSAWTVFGLEHWIKVVTKDNRRIKILSTGQFSDMASDTEGR